MFRVCSNTENKCNVCTATAKYECVNGFGMCIECAEKIVVDVATTTNATTSATKEEAIWRYNDITQGRCNACRTSIIAGMSHSTINMCMLCINYLIDVIPVVASNSELKEQTVHEYYDSDSEPEPYSYYRGNTRMCLEETSDCNTSRNVVARTQSYSEYENNVTRMCRGGICVSDDE
jgi:hypothetical protein